MPVPAAWIANGWIFSERAEQNGKFWISNNRIWGPTGTVDVDTRYWIQDGWIWARPARRR